MHDLVSEDLSLTHSAPHSPSSHLHSQSRYKHVQISFQMCSFHPFCTAHVCSMNDDLSPIDYVTLGHWSIHSVSVWIICIDSNEVTCNLKFSNVEYAYVLFTFASPTNSTIVNLSPTHHDEGESNSWLSILNNTLRSPNHEHLCNNSNKKRCEALSNAPNYWISCSHTPGYSVPPLPIRFSLTVSIRIRICIAPSAYSNICILHIPLVWHIHHMTCPVGNSDQHFWFTKEKVIQLHTPWGTKHRSSSLICCMYAHSCIMYAYAYVCMSHKWFSYGKYILWSRNAVPYICEFIQIMNSSDFQGDTYNCTCKGPAE